MAVLVFVSVGRAQVGREKCFYVHALDGSLAGQGELYLEPNDTNQPTKLNWRKPGDLTFPSPSLAMPFDRAGGIAFISSTSGSARYLVSGWGPAAGYLVVVRADAQPQPTLSIEQSASLGTLDPVRVCWTDQAVFIIDALGQKLRSAAWNGLGQVPSAFADVIGTSSLPALEVGALLDLAAATPDGVVVFPFGRGVAGGSRVHWTGSSWSIQKYAPPVGDPLQFGLKDNVYTTPSAGPVTVIGPVGSFSIVEEYSGNIKGSGTSVAPWQPVTVNLVEELVPGRRHLITSSASLEDYLFIPSVRHGTPRVQPTLWTQVGLVATTHVNHGWTGPACRLTRSNPSAYLGTPASIWISLRDVNGNDPVTPVPPVPPGTTAFLTPLATVDFVAQFDPGKKSLGVGMPLTIPDDSELEGLVMLFQVVAITPDGQNFVASDVFGTTILGESETDARPSDKSNKGQRIWATMSREARARAYRRGEAWLQTLTKRIPEREKTVFQTIQAMR
jgi:hypothetical protein